MERKVCSQALNRSRVAGYEVIGKGRNEGGSGICCILRELLNIYCPARRGACGGCVTRRDGGQVGSVAGEGVSATIPLLLSIRT